MTGSARRAAVLLSFLLAAGSAAAQEGALRAAPPPPGTGEIKLHRPPGTITVIGEGRVAVPPDAASFTVGVQATAKTVAAATAEVSARMKAVLDAVAKAGVAAKDVRTVRYDVSIDRPWKDGKPQPITGYTVTNAADVKVRDLSRLGKILEAVTAAGSNQVQSLRMERLDPKPQQLEALALAYASARDKARALALAAGADVGDLVSVVESGAQYRPVPMQARTMAMAADAAPVPVAEGELEYSARVEAVFGMR